MSDPDGMEFEAHEIERGFDFANLTFGAFLSAYLGIQLVQTTPSNNDIIKLVCLLGAIALIGHSLRALAITLAHGIQTKPYLLTSLVSFVAGSIGYVTIVVELSYPKFVMGALGLGWLATCLIVSIPMISRRWIKFYD